MHHALQIQEILLNIFGHCLPPKTKARHSNLAALVRTCRTFKEPALDILWEELYILSPLARCVPEASHISIPSEIQYLREYSFSRPLTQSEWDILRSYTRRVRYIFMREYYYGLDSESIKALSKPTAVEPIFLNVRHLYCNYDKRGRPLLSLRLPSLISFKIVIHTREELEGCLKPFAEITQNLSKLSISLGSDASIETRRIKPNFICWWRSLRSVDCFEVSLDVDTLLYLSLMPALTRLKFELNDTLLDASNSPIIFPHLHEFILSSKSLPSISRLLSQVQLPTITELLVFFQNCPSKRDVASFLYGLQEYGIGHTIHVLRVLHLHRTDESGSKPLLVVKDLEPCMAFTNLRRLEFDVGWKVNLTDSELLMLVSAWPQLELFCINTDWGWDSLGGITPNGWLQLLRKCPSLCRIALAIDTRGYIEVPPLSENVGLTTMPWKSRINVVDSFIDEESVPAMAAFFAGIAPHPDTFFCGWWGLYMPPRDVCKTRWEDVGERLKDAIRRRS